MTYIIYYLRLAWGLTSANRADQAFQVVGLRDAQQNRMIAGLSALFYDADGSTSIQRGGSNHINEIAFAHMEGAGAGDQDSAWAQHFESTQIEFFVAAH